MITQIDINRYHFEILDLLDEGEMIYFSEDHADWNACCTRNNYYNIIFYPSNIEPLMVQFVNMCREIPSNEDLILYGCPMCGAP